MSYTLNSHQKYQRENMLNGHCNAGMWCMPMAFVECGMPGMLECECRMQMPELIL